MKLLKVIANNFKLCEKDFTMSFVPIANKTTEDKEFELMEIAENLYTYATIGIIGKNGSGKTMTTELLAIVYDILSNFRIKATSHIFKYIKGKLNLEIYFYHENYLYRYITDIYKNESTLDNESVLFENQKLYKKAYMKSYSNKIFEVKDYKEVPSTADLPYDTSILYLLLKKMEIKGAYCESDDSWYKSYAYSFTFYNIFGKHPTLIKKILTMFDEHIINLAMVNENKFKITFKNKEEQEVTERELHDILSSGTSKGFNLFTFVMYSLLSGNDLIVDEIENHFHRTLVENLINLYKDKTVNKKNATIIFTTHYPELLDLFNRSDNIYICKHEKNIYLENMHEKYKIRSILSKSSKFYENAFNTAVDYEALMDFKKELM